MKMLIEYKGKTFHITAPDTIAHVMALGLERADECLLFDEIPGCSEDEETDASALCHKLWQILVCEGTAPMGEPIHPKPDPWVSGFGRAMYDEDLPTESPYDDPLDTAAFMDGFADYGKDE